MKDIDRIISRALASEAESFAPKDLAAAERRFLRARRKRRFTWFGGATLATAAAVVAVALFPRPELVTDRAPQRVAGTVLTEISVGESPVSVAVSRTAVWVANSGDGTVSRIDPETREVVTTIEVGGAPEEIVAGDFATGRVVWAYEAQSRRVLEIDPATNEVVSEYSDAWLQGTHIDLALTDAALWMADPVSESVYLGSHREDDPSYTGPESASGNGMAGEAGGDVARESEGGEAWSYNGSRGTLTLLQGRDGTLELGRGPRVTDVLTSENGDLAVGGGAMWVSDDFGVIMRVDRKTYKKQYIDLGGRHSDLSYGGGYLWALTTEEEEGAATLRRIDPTTGDVVGDPIPLKDEPVDVSADNEAVWVAHKAGDSVTRIDVTTGDKEAEPEPTPSASPEELSDPLGPDELVMVFSGLEERPGELFAMYGDGDTEMVKFPIEADLYPSFVLPLYSKGPAVVIERRHVIEGQDLEEMESRLLYVDVMTGEDEMLVEGSLPAVSSRNQLAYWRMEADTPTLVITEIGTDFERLIPLVEGPPRAISWDQGGRYVYVESSAVNGDVRVLSYDSTGKFGPVELDPGANAFFLAPSSREVDSIHLIRIESDGDESDGPVDSIKLVEARDVSLDSGSYTEIVDLGELGVDEEAFRPENPRLTATGNLDAVREPDGSLRWGLGEERSWIVGFHTEAWLVKESGEIVALGEIAYGGLTVAPELLAP
jgi:YVTN family beta-propeller protein